MLSWYCSAISNLRNSGGTALEVGGVSGISGGHLFAAYQR